MDDSTAQSMEQQNVHQVYEEIAQHFSDTRYKKWPVVEKFIPATGFGVDIGCGNGKYLLPNMIGCDRSTKLLSICKTRGHEVFIADCLNTMFRADLFDFAISIAVLHHLSTLKRRQDGIKEILRILKKNGVALLYVWAFEQESTKRVFKTQDEMVSWTTLRNGQQVVYDRYYHLFKQGELDALCIDTKMCEIVKSGYDRDNYYVIIKKI